MSIDVNCTAWQGFCTGEWRHLVNVRNFIQKNYTPYSGNGDFLAPVSTKTAAVWKKAEALIIEEVKKGIIDVETNAVSGIDNFAPGYIDQENEVIVGLQTDAPLKRIVNPFGGIRNATSALEQYGYQLNPEIERHFRLYRKTHNEGVFDAYPERRGCSPACPTPMAGAASWATTAGCPCTAPTSSLRRSRPTWTASTAP